MTIEQALAMIRSYRENVIGDWAEVFDIAIKSLEKSIPQKPNKATTRYDEFIRFECPVCGGFLVKNYPCKCGQMIDWGDE